VARGNEPKDNCKKNQSRFPGQSPILGVFVARKAQRQEMLKSLFVGFGVCSLLISCNVILAQSTQNTTGTAASIPQAAPIPQAISDQDAELMRSDIRSKKKQVVAANVSLTPDEASKFWPLYDQYMQETIPINDERWALLKEYSANFSNMTDQVAQDYMDHSTDVDQKLIAVRRKYVPLFQNVISTKKTAQWYQVDRRLDLMMNMQMLSMVPVVTASK
jgi:hypothetical protein